MRKNEALREETSVIRARNAALEEKLKMTRAEALAAHLGAQASAKRVIASADEAIRCADENGGVPTNGACAPCGDDEEDE